MTQADPFRTLYDANYPRVRRLLARIVGPDEAEDLTQTVFAKVAAALPGFRGDAQASTWLYRIAANVAADWLRSRPAHEAARTVPLAEASQGEESEAHRLAPLDEEPSPEQELIRKQMAECIRDVVAELPEGPRTVLMLADLGGLNDDDLAQALGIRHGTAKVRLHRARALLRQELEQRCDFYRDPDNELACDPKPTGCGQRSGCSGGADPQPP